MLSISTCLEGYLNAYVVNAMNYGGQSMSNSVLYRSQARVATIHQPRRNRRLVWPGKTGPRVLTAGSFSGSTRRPFKIVL